MDKNRDNEIEGFYTYSLNGEAEQTEHPEEREEPNASEQREQPPRPAPKPESRPPQERPEASRDSGDSGRQRSKERDFKVNFDFDREYEDVPKDSPIHVKRTRRTGCLGGVFFAVFIICVSLILASLLWLAATDVLGFGADEGVVQVTVPKDFTVDDIADILYEADLIKYKKLFLFYSKFSDVEEKIKSGTYELNLNFDYHALVKGLSSSGARVTTDVTFPEGYTLLQIFGSLEQNDVCTAEDMWEAAASSDFEYDFLEGIPLGDSHRLEGFLFPDTYTFYKGDSPKRVLTIMLDNFNNRFTEENYVHAEALGYTVREIIIIASMIEREAKVDEDRSLIASVIYNRLKSSDYPRLEIDATIRYVIAETGEPFSTSLDSPYNTYAVEGLPPGPISNPGLKSIQAALDPDNTDYFFYALKHDGSHKFSHTYEEHTAFVNSDEYGG